MNPMKRAGLKLFSLCVLALGLVAFSATAAQAEGIWMVGGSNIEAAKTEKVVGKLKNNTGTLLSTLGLNKVDFTCTKGELIEAKLEKEGAISETSKNAKVFFSGCTTKVNGTLAPKCEPKATGKVAGTIETEVGSALLKLHTATGDAVTVITPAVGNVFAVIHMGEACAIGEAVKVFGTLALKDVGGNKGLLEEKKIHEVEEFKALTELKVANETSSGAATLDGIAEVEVVTGANWNGLDK